jgi:protoporphyrinogen/coproporphyrinogen III oxidase
VDGAHYDAAVVACPLPVAFEICPGHSGLLGPLNSALGYTQAITVAIGTKVRPESPAFLVQLSSRDEPDVALMFLDHNKGPGRTPPGHGLIGCCWETDASTRWLERSDDEIGDQTLASVYRVFPELEGQVDLVHVTRWTHALPWTRIGSYQRIGEFNAALDPRARVQFAGDYMSAAGQHTAVEFGTKAARNLITALG